MTGLCADICGLWYICFLSAAYFPVVLHPLTSRLGSLLLLVAGPWTPPLEEARLRAQLCRVSALPRLLPHCPPRWPPPCPVDVLKMAKEPQACPLLQAKAVL